MKVVHKKELSTGITLLIGASSWNKDEISIKYG